MHSLSKFITLLSLSLSPLLSEEVIEVVCKFPVDTVFLNNALEKQGSSLKLVQGSLPFYDALLKKEKASLLSFFQKEKKAILNSHKVIFYDLPGKSLRKWDLTKLPKERLVLFMWEPPVVMSDMYDPKTASLFHKIYTWNDALVDNKIFFKFHYPVLREFKNNLPSFQQRKLCTLINSNLVKKNKKNELYSQRLLAIDFFETHHPEAFEFYGRGWDSNEHPLYKGAPEDKNAVLKNYRFSICYENMTNIQGYITEKIFDSFCCGCIPVYWGATNITDYIPKDCFLDRRDFASLEALYQRMKTMSEEEYRGYLTRIQMFLKSEAAQRFSLESFEKTFWHAVQ